MDKINKTVETATNLGIIVAVGAAGFIGYKAFKWLEESGLWDLGKGVAGAASDSAKVIKEIVSGDVPFVDPDPSKTSWGKIINGANGFSWIDRLIGDYYRNGK